MQKCYITPDWPAPNNVKALVTTRNTGVSNHPYKSFNLALHVGDNPAHVLENRHKLQQLTGAQLRFQWLNQVHGNKIIQAAPSCGEQTADAIYTHKSEMVCAVLTADCLPVFFCDSQGSQVALAHAGWRGLATGILENTIDTFSIPTSDLLVWLGPAIGPQKFEVGDDVRNTYLSISKEFSKAFLPIKHGYWYADIYMLATIKLNMCGVEAIYGGKYCTFTDQNLFYSYRKEGVTGRMASLIWMDH